MTLRYAVIFEQAQNNWAAYVPDLRTLQEFGDPVPHPTSVAKEIEIQPAA
jgi:hypothetical protein